MTNKIYIIQEQESIQASGRTFFTGRCNCYRGHNSNSGRCHEGQGSGLYTLPERQGICARCWENCREAQGS